MIAAAPLYFYRDSIYNIASLQRLVILCPEVEVLSQNEKEEVRKKLLDLRKDIFFKIRMRTGGLQFDPISSRPGGDADGGKDIDAAQDEQTVGIDLAIVDLLSKEDSDVLSQIENSMISLENNTYGLCCEPECRQVISYKRLMARPFAKRCVQCQEEHESATQSQSIRSYRR